MQCQELSFPLLDSFFTGVVSQDGSIQQGNNKRLVGAKR